jgi:cytochrome c oxidase subunit 3
MFMVATAVLATIFLIIKWTEYQAKFVHYGIFIKKASYAKYEEALKHENAKVNEYITVEAFEVTGHLHDFDASQPLTKTYLEIVPDQIKGGHAEAHEEHASNEKAMGGGGAGGHGSPVKIDLADVIRWGNFTPKYSTFFAIYFTMTGLHALHIIGGIIVLLYMAGPGAAIYFKDPEWLANRVEVTGLFWHFVDLVWIFLFPVLYLL